MQVVIQNKFNKPKMEDELRENTVMTSIKCMGLILVNIDKTKIDAIMLLTVNKMY